MGQRDGGTEGWQGNTPTLDQGRRRHGEEKDIAKRDGEKKHGTRVKGKRKRTRCDDRRFLQHTMTFQKRGTLRSFSSAVLTVLRPDQTPDHDLMDDFKLGMNFCR